MRLETTMLFAQAVYLMFSAVYICKETVEHLLLAAGSSHHHHSGDEDAYTPEGYVHIQPLKTEDANACTTYLGYYSLTCYWA